MTDELRKDIRETIKERTKQSYILLSISAIGFFYLFLSWSLLHSQIISVDVLALNNVWKQRIVEANFIFALCIPCFVCAYFAIYSIICDGQFKKINLTEEDVEQNYVKANERFDKTLHVVASSLIYCPIVVVYLCTVGQQPNSLLYWLLFCIFLLLGVMLDFVLSRNKTQRNRKWLLIVKGSCWMFWSYLVFQGALYKQYEQLGAVTETTTVDDENNTSLILWA